MLRTVTALFLLSLVAACGVRGPLYHADNPEKEVAKDPYASNAPLPGDPDYLPNQSDHTTVKH